MHVVLAEHPTWLMVLATGTEPMWYRLLADAVLVAHLAYVGFVVLGMATILVGIARGWRWVRNFWFRAVHFLLIAVVAAESLGRLVCPLTTWEYRLRLAAGEEGQPGSLVGRLIHRLMFVQAPEWLLSVVYCVFAAAVLAALILAPPRWPWRKGK